MADDLRRLLDYIIDHPILHDETVEAQLDASAGRAVPVAGSRLRSSCPVHGTD